MRPKLPIASVDFILGNDLAGGKVFLLPEVISKAVSAAFACRPASFSSVPSVFPVCAITCAQAHQMDEAAALSD